MGGLRVKYTMTDARANVLRIVKMNPTGSTILPRTKKGEKENVTVQAVTMKTCIVVIMITMELLVVEQARHLAVQNVMY
jgi:hypothetical protein